jgi:hypothetical protein
MGARFPAPARRKPPPVFSQAAAELVMWKRILAPIQSDENIKADTADLRTVFSYGLYGG